MNLCLKWAYKTPAHFFRQGSFTANSQGAMFTGLKIQVLSMLSRCRTYHGIDAVGCSKSVCLLRIVCSIQNFGRVLESCRELCQISGGIFNSVWTTCPWQLRTNCFATVKLKRPVYCSTTAKNLSALYHSGRTSLSHPSTNMLSTTKPL